MKLQFDRFNKPVCVVCGCRPAATLQVRISGFVCDDCGSVYHGCIDYAATLQVPAAGCINAASMMQHTAF